MVGTSNQWLPEMVDIGSDHLGMALSIACFGNGISSLTFIHTYEKLGKHRDRMKLPRTAISLLLRKNDVLMGANKTFDANKFIAEEC